MVEERKKVCTMCGGKYPVYYMQRAIIRSRTPPGELQVVEYANSKWDLQYKIVGWLCDYCRTQIRE